MHPAPSIILFTVLSGLGLGLLAFLGLGPLLAPVLPGIAPATPPTGFAAFVHYGLGYALTLGGLAASAFHLGHPERALRAFSQWRTSWLSREAVLAAATLALMAPHAAGLVFLGRPLPALGALAGALALVTVVATAMIYAQLRTVPRWNHWTTPALFLIAALAGGALLAGAPAIARWLLIVLALVLVAHWQIGDGRFAQAGSTLASATGLGRLGTPRLLEPPHTGTNYLLREMVHVVGRKHAHRLRLIALAGAALIPAALLWVMPSLPGLVLAVLLHLAGMLAARWLFFAQAEHVVGLYYGKR